MALARAQFASLMATGLSPGPNLSSYRDKLVLSPARLSESRPPIQHSRLTRDQQIRKKVAEIRSRSTPLHPICMKCGEKGHKAHECRNARICFICNRSGHKGAFCDTVTSTSPHSRFSRGETNRFSEHIAMAPPRRGYPRTRPPYRPYQRHQHTSHSGVPMAGPDPIPATQVPPDRPFTGVRNPPPQAAPHLSQAPSGIAQTPPDRPVQRTQRAEQPRERPVLPAPPPTPPPVRDIHPPILMLNSTPESEAILRELQMSFLLDDIAGWGPEKVERVLRYSFPPFLWVVRVYDEFTYLIQAPSDDWLIAATRRRWLRVEEAQFPILRWDPSFNAGNHLHSVWVRVFGFPMDKWVWGEFNGIFMPFGAIVLELDPGTLSRYDYRFARIRIGIGNINVLPRHHSLTHRNASGFVSSYDLEFEIETDTSEPVNAWRGRLNGRPFPNGTPFGGRPAPPPSNTVTDQTAGPTARTSPRPISGSSPMVEDGIGSNPIPSTFQIPTSSNLPPINSNTHPFPGPPVMPNGAPADTGPFVFPRLGLHGPSPQPPRQRGIVFTEPSSITLPVLGHSPTGKGKATLPSCAAEGKHPQGYETDDSDSDEDSFQNALNAIYQREGGVASSTTNPSSHSTEPSHPPLSNDKMVSDIDSSKLADTMPTPTILEHPLSPASDSDSSILLADLIHDIRDEEPLPVRAKKLQAKKKNSSIKKS